MASQSSTTRRIALAALAIFGLNAVLCGPLFHTEYLDAFQSNEGVFIVMSRLLLRHWPHAGWFPWFDGGTPLENAYFPLTPFVVAGLAFLARCSPALAFHFWAALTYSLAPVCLFLFARRLSGRLAPSLWAALLWSLFSPSDLVPELLGKMGGPWGSRRLYNVVFNGETPHSVALCLVPLALWLLVRYWETPGARRFAICALAVGATMLSNAFGFSVIVISFALLFLAIDGDGWKRLVSAAAILAAGYALICRMLPPSLLGLIGTSAQSVGGDYRYARIGLLMPLFLAAMGAVWLLTRRLPGAMLRFAVLVCAFFGTVTVLWYWKEIALLPSPHRYALELEAGLCLLAAFALDPVLRRVPGRVAAVLAAMCVLPLGAVAVQDYRFARRLIRPVDITRTVPFRQARWIAANFPGQRVMVSGENEYWFNLFAENPQLSVGHEASAPNWVQRVAVYTIYSGQNAGEQDGPISVLWLKAFGCGAVTVPGPDSADYFHPFAHPGKFDGLLPLVWRESGESVYRVPLRSASLAHVIPVSAVAMKRPVHGLDVELVRRYVAALEDPAKPEASLTWQNPDRGRLVADAGPGDVISVQITYDPGWRASVGGRPVNLYPDGLGMMVVQPRCAGACAIDLVFTGGTERHVCFAVGCLAALALAGMVVWPGKSVRNRVIQS